MAKNTSRQDAKEARQSNIVPQTQTAVKTFSGMKSDMIAKALESYKMQIGYLLPKSIPPMQFFHTCINVLSDPRNEKLRGCTQRSIIGGILTGSMLGLSFAKQLGQAHLVPFRNNAINADEAEFIIGYQGHLELMMRTGRVSAIDVEIIYEKDNWNIELGTNKRIEHRPAIDNNRIQEDRGKPIILYWIVTGKDGHKKFDWMPMDKVYREHRDKSKAYLYAVKKGYAETPWIEFEEEMIKKTGLIMARKLIGGTIEDQIKAAVDNSIIRLQDFQPRPGLEPGSIENLNLSSVYNVESDDQAPAEKEPEESGQNGKGKEEAQQPIPVTEIAKTLKQLLFEKASRVNDTLKKKVDDWLEADQKAMTPDDIDEKGGRELLIILQNL